MQTTKGLRWYIENWDGKETRYDGIMTNEDFSSAFKILELGLHIPRGESIVYKVVNFQTFKNYQLISRFRRRG